MKLEDRVVSKEEDAERKAYCFLKKRKKRRMSSWRWARRRKRMSWSLMQTR